MSAIRGFMENMGFFVSSRLAALLEDDLGHLLRRSASSIIGLVEDIYSVFYDLTENNEALLSAGPPILPHQLSKIEPRNLVSNFFQRHRCRLEATMTPHEIEKIEQHHKNLVDAYRPEASMKSSIDSFEDGAEYGKAWAGHNAVYPELERFVGGLATIFPDTSTIDSDFSVVKSDKRRTASF